MAAGAWFVLFGLSGKLSTLISAIPAPVIGGVFVVVCGIISVSGMKVMSDVTIHEKEMYVIAVPIIMTLALTLLPKEFLETLPQFYNIYLVHPWQLPQLLLFYCRPFYQTFKKGKKINFR